MKFFNQFTIVFLLSAVSAEIYGAEGISTTRTSSKWYAVNQAYGILAKQCNGNISNIKISTEFSHSTGFVGKVKGDCNRSEVNERFLFWSYDYRKGDPYVNHRADEWIRKVDLETASQICQKQGKRKKALTVLSNGNSETAKVSEFVSIFDANLEFQWIAWKLICV